MVNNKNKPLKIGMLSFYYPHLGGSGIMATRMAEQFVRSGHKVHFIGYDTDENPPDMEELGVQLHRVRKVDYPCMKNEPYVWTLGSRLCDVHKEVGLDLVHANYAVPHALPAYAAREKLKLDGINLPYIVTGHGSDIHTNGSKLDINPLLRLCLNKADALTFVSKDLQRIAEEELGITKESIHIPNFVDTEKFFKKDTNYRKSVDIPDNAFVLGHVSNFTPIKEVFRFEYIAQRLKNDGVLSNVYFLMCGEGRDRVELEERIRRIGLESRFRFVGKLDYPEILEAYNAMDVFLLTSKHEGHPLVFLEAMACEKPLIGTDVGGISEVIDDDIGFLVTSGKPEEVSKAIQYLKNNRDFREGMGGKGLERVRKEYSVERVMNKYLEVFNSVIPK